MITALVKYKEWVNGGHPQLEGYFEQKSIIVDVEKLTDINNMFDHIEDVKKI